MSGQEAVSLLKESYADWNADKAPRLGAALAYYTAFALAPLLLVVLAIAGLVLDRSQVLNGLLDQIYATFGAAAGDLIKGMLTHPSAKSQLTAAIMGFAATLLGAAGLFGQLQDALNTIWGVQPKPNLGFMVMLRNRFLSFAMVLGCGFLLLVSLALSAAVAALSGYLDQYFASPLLVEGLNALISLAVITLLFAMIFKVLPDVEIDWRDVRTGAALTAVLFIIGKFALGLYLARSGMASTYGAAGSLVIILFWVYYAAQILFFGAEFTKVYARKYGSKIIPSPYAEAVSVEARARQGLQTPPPAAPTLDNPRHDVAPAGLAHAEAQHPRSRQTLEDTGAVLAGLGLVFLVTRLLFRERG